MSKIGSFKKVEMNDIELYHVTGILHGASTFETWINPEKNYRPERFMYTSAVSSHFLWVKVAIRRSLLPRTLSEGTPIPDYI